MRLRVLSWEMTGLPIGPGELAAALHGWDWDVALLDGVARGWCDVLTRSLDSELRAVPPARGLRRLLPGGRRTHAVILARHDRIVEHRFGRAGARGWAHAVQLGCGVWIAGATGARVDGAEIAARKALGWAAGAPLVLALAPSPQPAAELAAAGPGLFVAGHLRVEASGQALDPGLDLHPGPAVVEVALSSVGIPS